MNPLSTVVVVGLLLLVLLYVVRPRRIMLLLRVDPAGRAGGGADTLFPPVVDAASLDALFARSQDAPVILFLHDTGCPISAAAYRQMRRLGGAVPLIDVQRARDASQAVQARTGVRHESQQVIVVRRGRVVWSASHQAITAQAVAAAMAEERQLGREGRDVAR